MLKRIRKHYKENPINIKEKVSLDKLRNLKIAYIPYNELLKEGFFAGIGWAFGVTIGFVVVSTLLVFIFSRLGGLPLVGNWIADLVQETQAQLIKRTPVFK